MVQSQTMLLMQAFLQGTLCAVPPEGTRPGDHGGSQFSELLLESRPGLGDSWVEPLPAQSWERGNNSNSGLGGISGSLGCCCSFSYIPSFKRGC